MNLHSMLHWNREPLPSPSPLWLWCCKCKGCDNYCRTQNLTQSTWTNPPKFGSKLLWSCLYENFHKFNFCNDHVILKIMNIFYYEIWGNQYLQVDYLCSGLSCEFGMWHWPWLCIPCYRFGEHYSKMKYLCNRCHMKLTCGIDCSCVSFCGSGGII